MACKTRKREKTSPLSLNSMVLTSIDFQLVSTFKWTFDLKNIYQIIVILKNRSCLLYIDLELCNQLIMASNPFPLCYKLIRGKQTIIIYLKATLFSCYVSKFYTFPLVSILAVVYTIGSLSRCM